MIVRTEAELRQAMLLQSESEHLEFKEAKSDYDFDKLADYSCALGNEGGGSIILGVTDKMPRRIVGTTAFSNLDRTKEGPVRSPAHPHRDSGHQDAGRTRPCVHRARTALSSAPDRAWI